MKQPKYTCKNCESEKEPYFSRSEPMGFYCQDCGQNSDQLAVIPPNASRSHLEEQNDHECELAAWELLKEAKAELTAERALADRLAGVLSKFDYRSADYMHSTSTDVDGAIAALAAWKEARSE
jgi:hypothetical protein